MLERLVERKEEYWKVRLRSNWLLYSDRNTDYFHHHASQQKEKAYIISLQIHNGQILTEHGEVKDHVVDFYKSLFGFEQVDLNFEDLLCDFSVRTFLQIVQLI